MSENSGPDTPTSDEGTPGLPDSPAAHEPEHPAAGAVPAALIPDSWLSRLLVPAYETKGWLKFLGVISICIGGLQALSLFGLIVAWLYIWLGVLLWQAGDRAAHATAQRDPAMLEQYMRKLKTVIEIAGVTTAVGAVLAVLSLGIFVVLALLGSLSSLMEYDPF